jgi:TonB-dependent starch-binding outer membrane protein SusC
VDLTATTAAADYAYSSGAYSDASYIRLKNLAFAYSLPSSLLKKLFIKDCAVYINAENLLTITGYKVGDPETQTIYEVPLQRIIVAGVKLNF